MPPRSKIDSLPKDVREELEQRLAASGFADYRGLSDWLKEKGFEISKSSIHAYGQSFEEKLGSLRRVTEQARIIVAENPDDDGAVNDALIRLVQEKAFTLLQDMDVDPDEVDLPKLMKVVADLSRASVSQKRLMAEMRKRDAEKLNAAVADGRINAEAAQEARRVLGFAE